MKIDEGGLSNRICRVEMDGAKREDRPEDLGFQGNEGKVTNRSK